MKAWDPKPLGNQGTGSMGNELNLSQAITEKN